LPNAAKPLALSVLRFSVLSLAHMRSEKSEGKLLMEAGEAPAPKAAAKTKAAANLARLGI
jgi:hypothetical protein